MIRLVALFVVVIAAPAWAAEPTVTLTQSELSTLIQGAVAEQQATPAMRAAAPIMAKVREAFAPKPPATPSPAKKP